LGVDDTALADADADADAADGGVAEAAEPPLEAHPPSNPVTATIAKAPRAFGPERIM
jgi:hypothetical protein